MDINTTTGPIAKLFYGNQEQFIIPAYQRRYSWQNKQINQLFSDMKNLGNDETHFMGSVVCLVQSYKAGINKLELVDGQQRMTTLVLVIDTIKDRFETLGMKREADRLEDLISCGDYDESGSKLVLGDLDKDDFRKILNLDKVDTVVNKQLYEAYQTIKANLDKMSDEELIIFKDKLLNRTIIVRLDVSKSRDAFKLFETINNRGLSLSPTDIIKNFLLGHASMIDEVTLDKVKKSWTKIIVNMDGRKLDDFFRQYLMGEIGRKVTFTMLTDTFKKYYIDNVQNTNLLGGYEIIDEEIESGEDVKERRRITPSTFLSQLEQASLIYSKILNQTFDNNDINKAIRRLEMIRSFASYTFVLNLMQRELDTKTKVKVLEILQVFMIRRNICSYQTGELDELFAKMCMLEDDNLVANVKEFVLQDDRMPSDKLFGQSIVTSDFYGQQINRAKCMLEAIETSLMVSDNEKDINWDKVHLEHIIPQTITTKRSRDEEGGDWVIYLGSDSIEEHPKFVSKIGNMTLLAGDKNIQASNNPFASKREIYKNKTEFKITNNLAKGNDFNFDSVTERSKKIAKDSVKIWKF